MQSRCFEIRINDSFKYNTFILSLGSHTKYIGYVLKHLVPIN